MRFKIITATVGAAVGLLGAAVVGTPASAEIGPLGEHYNNHGQDYQRVGSDHKWVEVCDMEQDGNGVLGRFRLSGGGILERGDTNGSAGGCGNTTSGVPIIDMMLCEEGDCTGWIPIRN
jgi:hypothetical protein